MNRTALLQSVFQDRVVFLTGASSGIGREMAKLLVASGARVHSADYNADGLASLAREVEGPGCVRTHAFDVSDASAYLSAVDDAERIDGPLDFLFNNAGVTLVGAAHTIPFERWKWLLDINVMGVVNGIQIVYPRMTARGKGHIINTASIAGSTGYASACAYAASKAFVIGLSQSTRAEAKAYGVKISLACPGYVDTNIFSQDRVVGVKVDQMLGDLPVKLLSPGNAAWSILKGVARGKQVIVFPFSGKIIWYLSRWAPWLLTPSQKRLMRPFS